MMADLNSWGDLQPYLHFLRCRTRSIGLDPRMQAKFDLDDIVHEVILRAMDSAEPAEQARLAWLTTILECVIIDKWRELNAGKRDLDREVRFRQQLAESTACWENSFAAGQLSPSECAMQNETRLRVVDAVERLPEREREVAVLHFFAGMSLAATAEVLGLTRGAVGNLHRNVMSFLRKNLDG